MNKLPPIVLACIGLAAATILAREFLWDLGTIYWIVLGALAAAQLGATVYAFRAGPRRPWIRPTVVVLLVIGQWWLIAMLAAWALWAARGFAP